MNEHMGFRYKRFADAAASHIRGWDRVRVIQLHLPEHINANHRGNVWTIQITRGNSDPMYLRQGGYVQ